jgi:hypothetical protein
LSLAHCKSQFINFEGNALTTLFRRGGQNGWNKARPYTKIKNQFKNLDSIKAISSGFFNNNQV